VIGPFVDQHTHIHIDGAGVHPQVVAKGPYNVSGHDVGKIVIQFGVRNDAPLGERKFGIYFALGLLGSDQLKFKVVAPRVTDAPSEVTMGGYFDKAEVTLRGESIGNAHATAAFAVSEGGRSLTTEILENDNSSIKLRFKFPELIAFATVDIRLINKTTRLPYTGFTNKDLTKVKFIGPNAVKSITFPDGNSVTVGSVFTIQINLVKPAGTGGELVSWQLVPSNVFEEAQGSGTRFSPTGLNRERIPQNNTLVRLQVRLKEIPQGCAQNCTAEVQTRMGNINTDQSPYFKSARFTIIAPRP
jgi:hypothetical protein